MKILDFIKCEKERELFEKMVVGHEREFNASHQCILYENKLFDQTYSYVTLEAQETDSLDSMANSLRFRVDFYDLMGMETEAELVHQEFYEFTVDGYNAAKKWADDVIDAIKADETNIPLF